MKVNEVAPSDAVEMVSLKSGTSGAKQAGASEVDGKFSKDDYKHDELGMMDDFVISTHLRVFMLQRIETMGACRDNFFNFVIVQGFDVFLRHHLVQHLIADPSGKVAGAFFFHAQNCKADTCFLQDFDQADRYFFGSIIKRTGASDPE